MRSSDWSSDVCSSDLAGRIAHGMLSASFISTVFGTRLPGPGCIYLRQDLRFKAPVKIGDTVEARVTVKEIQAAKKRVIFDTVCKVRDSVVLEGEATLMVASRKEMAGATEANDCGAPTAPPAAATASDRESVG